MLNQHLLTKYIITQDLFFSARSQVSTSLLNKCIFRLSTGRNFQPSQGFILHEIRGNINYCKIKPWNACKFKLSGIPRFYGKMKPWDAWKFKLARISKERDSFTIKHQSKHLNKMLKITKKKIYANSTLLGLT